MDFYLKSERLAWIWPFLFEYKFTKFLEKNLFYNIKIFWNICQKDWPQRQKDIPVERMPSSLSKI